MDEATGSGRTVENAPFWASCHIVVRRMPDHRETGVTLATVRAQKTPNAHPRPQKRRSQS